MSLFSSRKLAPIPQVRFPFCSFRFEEGAWFGRPRVDAGHRVAVDRDFFVAVAGPVLDSALVEALPGLLARLDELAASALTYAKPHDPWDRDLVDPRIDCLNIPRDGKPGTFSLSFTEDSELPPVSIDVDFVGAEPVSAQWVLV